MTEGQLKQVIHRKILDALAAPVPDFTRRDVHLPSVPGKAVAVIGMRRTGKTTLLWQILSDRLAGGLPREGCLFFGFEDDRLARTPDGTEELIQVCADLSTPEAESREVRSLLSASGSYPRASQHLIVLDPDTALTLPASIQLHRASTWLLSPS